jgi:hypothetical protein
MAELRLIVLALALAGTACRASEAGPSSGLTPPAGWQPLPSLATAAGDTAKQAAIALEGAEAWGDPARGCYAAWLGLRGNAGAPLAISDALLASFAIDLPGVTVADVVKPVANADAGIVSLTFTRPPYHGRLRAQLAKSGAITALACFWNTREPLACDAACGQLLGGMK